MRRSGKGQEEAAISIVEKNRGKEKAEATEKEEQEKILVNLRNAAKDEGGRNVKFGTTSGGGEGI